MLRTDVSVIVVGAGIAGLSSARHLIQAGFSRVTVLEASNRFGGRIQSVRVNDDEGPIELGATCVHGASMENPVFKMATEWGMALTVVDRIRGQYYKENGDKIDKELVERVWKAYLALEDSMDKRYSDRDDKTRAHSNTQSFAQYVQQTRPKFLQQFPEGEERDAADKVLNSMLNYCQFINGDELHRLSADLCGRYEGFSGPEMIFAGKGYTGFVENFLHALPKDTVKYNSQVVLIQWGGGDGTPKTANGQEGVVQVRCQNGETYTADHVIVTCPLGHLKANYKTLFQPELPERKAGAIERTGFGRVAKVFLYYDQPFWRDDGIKLARSQSGIPVTDAPGDWLRQLVGFDALPTNPKAIGNPFAGRGAEVMESLSDQEVSVACRDLLSEVLGDPDLPAPTRILRSTWNSDPLYGGGYSYLSVDSRERDMEDLAQPLPDAQRPALLFAGEATHPQYYSTVHGAHLSGVREGQRLVDLYEN